MFDLAGQGKAGSVLTQPPATGEGQPPAPLMVPLRLFDGPLDHPAADSWAFAERIKLLPLLPHSGPEFKSYLSVG